MFANVQSQKRSHETPMEFEWQTQPPLDPKSPWLQGKPQQNSNKFGFQSPVPQSSFMTAGANSTATPFRNSSFTTPRKPFEQDLFSEVSGAESTPGDNENTDADDTPDQSKTSQAMTSFTGGSAVKQPLFGKYGASFQGSSPGRAEQRRGKFGNALIQKVKKRKRLEKDYQLIRSHRGQSDSESDSGQSRPHSRRRKDKSQEPKSGWIGSFFSYIESHPNLPNVLSFYAQLAVNTFIAFLTMYGAYAFWTTIRADIDKISDREKSILLAEMRKCASDFAENKCRSPTRTRALDALCDNWEHCMNQDPNSVGRARISAHTFAEIFNSFVEPISIKAFVFLIVAIMVCLLVNNIGFRMFRNTSVVQHPPPHQPFFPPPQQPMELQWGSPQRPQTPKPRHIEYDIYGGQTYHAIMPSETPSQRSPSKGERSRSPSKQSRSPGKGNRDMDMY